ncbi:MAG TPA: amidohydrolase family protein [Pseudonocardiaceae bacterium]|nr:amidohydrolase family protein [Pseudonocardiaceae bacterium]
MTIDVHTHVVPLGLPDMAGRPGAERFPLLGNRAGDRAEVLVNGVNIRPVTSVCWDVGDRLRAMAKDGVTRQVISPMPALLTYWAEPAAAHYYADGLNDAIATMVGKAPDRLVGFGALPLQDPAAAAAAVPRLVELGMRGVEVGSNIDGRPLGDPAFFDVFRALVDADLAVFVHSMAPDTGRLVGVPILDNVVGFPSDVGLAAASVITGGLLTAVPGLRMVFSHGGGTFGSLLPRIAMGRRVFGADTLRMPEDPEALARSLWFDTLVYDGRTLRYLMDVLGSDHFMVGSDFPFVVREDPPGAVLDSSALAGVDEHALRHGNARRLLGEN